MAGFKAINIISRIFIVCLFLFLGAGSKVKAEVFFTSNYDLVGDGITDDGPAIVKLLGLVNGRKGNNSLVFESGKTYYVKDIGRGYLFEFTRKNRLTIDGAGSTFLLDGAVRFANIDSSENIRIKRLAIDYKPLPFADGVVLGINKAARYIEVKIPEAYEMPLLGGPVRKNGEQAFFGMLWNQGANSMLGTHYWVADIRETSSGSIIDRVFRIETNADFSKWDEIIPGKTMISIPLRGVAHLGGKEVIRIKESKDVALSEVEIWSAPWFAVGVTRNRGSVSFNKVNIRPKPGTERLTSSWRDGFHVKANYASLLWEDCVVAGTNDDAFNIASFMSVVEQVDSDGTLQIKQNYPLDIVPYNSGDHVVVYDVVNGKILGKAKVSVSTGFVQTGKPESPQIRLVLDEPIQGTTAGCQIWNESSANPKTLIRRCKIYNSCRFQSPISIVGSEIVALSWFYGSNLEGPLPSSISIKNSRLLLGRGNANTAVEVSSEMSSGEKLYTPTEPTTNRFFLKNSVVNGNINLNFVKNVRITGSDFTSMGGKLHLRKCDKVRIRNNY